MGGSHQKNSNRSLQGPKELSDESERVSAGTATLSLWPRRVDGAWAGSGGAVLLWYGAAGEAAFLVDEAGDGGMHRSELLQGSHMPEAQDRTFPPS